MNNNTNWDDIYALLNEKGYGIISNHLTFDECDLLSNLYHTNDYYRSVIVMERYRFGKGEYKYFNYPLPNIIQSLRESFYESLAPLANEWMQKLSIEINYPLRHGQFIEHCKAKGQVRSTPLILRYEAGGFNTLHQDLYGAVYFPFQVVFALSQKDKDFEGGEFVLTEQIPRAQSKADVIKLNKGDALVFTTNFRPVKGSKGYYRSTLKHGVSSLKSGVRYALGIPFHDAL